MTINEVDDLVAAIFANADNTARAKAFDDQKWLGMFGERSDLTGLTVLRERYQRNEVTIVASALQEYLNEKISTPITLIALADVLIGEAKDYFAARGSQFEKDYEQLVAKLWEKRTFEVFAFYYVAVYFAANQQRGIALLDYIYNYQVTSS